MIPVGEAAVSCYMDVVALLLLVMMPGLSERLRKRRSPAQRIFFVLVGYVILGCILQFVYHALTGVTSAVSHMVVLIAQTLWSVDVLIMVSLWLAYVDTKLYGRARPTDVQRVIRVLPAFIFIVLLVVNLFTGIIFTISEDNRFQGRTLYYVMTVTNFLLFLSSALSVWYYDRKSRKIRFLRVAPMIISVLASYVPQFVSRYESSSLGFSVGVTLLYFSLINEMRFVDQDSGLYNEGYRAYLFDLALAGKYVPQSALVVEAQGAASTVNPILRETLHREGDVIRLSDHKYVMFSGAQSRSTLEYIASLADEAAAGYNLEHPEDRVSLTSRCIIRSPDQDVLSFLQSAVNDEEVGDEVKGIVTMISELDRLDEELKLAGDIQINMLPMNFPAFPDRHEFDLYASMTPAKEVGGDFYDFFLVDEDHLALVIADVSGKGVPAALFMMVSKTMIKNHLLEGLSPTEALEQVNLQLCERNTSMMFVTVWLAVVEISTGRGVACNAGHENPGLRRAGGPFELLQYRHGMFVGVNKKARFTGREFELHPGDTVFVYTDGVPEANDESGGMFGEDRLVRVLNQHADDEPRALIGAVHEAIRGFVGGAPQFDDTTMLCMKYYGNSDKGDMKSEGTT